ncbi:MAG: hypothetical protein ACXIUM_09440 [Wenzhouxiangella sp.]
MPRAELCVIIPVAASDLAWRGLVRQLPQDWPILIAAAAAQPEGLAPHLSWLHLEPGRGRQLNAAAARTEAAWLWFVHADSRLDPKVLAQLQRWCAGRIQGLGYFDLGFLPDGPRLTRLNAVGANLRSRLFGLPYGDQGLCVSAREFWHLGGFREDLKRGEDLDFVVRARRIGLHPERIPGLIRTSARRYREHGWWRTTWQHQLSARSLIRQAKSSLQEPRQR